MHGPRQRKAMLGPNMSTSALFAQWDEEIGREGGGKKRKRAGGDEEEEGEREDETPQSNSMDSAGSSFTPRSGEGEGGEGGVDESEDDGFNVRGGKGKKGKGKRK